MKTRVALGFAAALYLAALANSAAPGEVRFVILGDRTGEAQPGVYERILREAAAEDPAFFITTGDAIQGLNDATAAAEWAGFRKLSAPYASFAWYLTPGNHDIWGDVSGRLYRESSGLANHYSFDSGSVHITVLDNSRTEALGEAEMSFLEADLRAHAAQPLKFIFSHRPSWIVDVLLGNDHFPLHALAKKYGVKYVVSGHIHQMWRAELDGVTYLSMPSAGGHLRASGKYEDGWFFAHTRVDVSAGKARFQIEETGMPAGQARITPLDAWGKAGLLAASF